MTQLLAKRSAVTYSVSPAVTNRQLDTLFATSWPDHAPSDSIAALRHSLAYICAFYADRLIGFVNVAWDGGIHAFLLDTTVHPDYRRRGIGRTLVTYAIAEARARHMTWIHVDYTPQLEEFYIQCGFRPTKAGLINLQGEGGISTHSPG